MKRMTSFVLLVLLAAMASADIPQVISYQGKVTDASGTPVADGPYTMRFRIYDALTGGSVLWDSANQSATVTDGVFSVLLGESPQPAITLDFGQDYWLDIVVGDDTQTPRVRMGSVGYAYIASGLVPGTEVIGEVTTGAQAAIKGTNMAMTGPGYGVCGQTSSSDGRGVYGRAITTSGVNWGGRFETESTEGVGVLGRANASTGTTTSVYGLNVSNSGTGVFGWTTANTGNTRGVWGESASSAGTGVFGSASAASGATYGVYGASSSTGGRGVYGCVNTTSGFTYGVYGETYSTAGRGVQGVALATSGITIGVVGACNSASGFGVYYQGGIGGSGLMRTVVNTSLGPTGLDAVTAAGSWVEDFGEGQLANGRCSIELDPLFLETVTVNAQNPMRVFIQLQDDCEGTFVTPGVTGFDVTELRGGISDAAFSYRVAAKRKGFETKRLDYCAAAERDSHLFPELREKESRERAAERARRDEERARMDGAR